jgi:hypothetical protein
MKNTIKKAASVILRPSLNKIHKFKDAHKRESCYIIGDGISIKWFDLSIFSDKISMPIALIPFHNDFHKLNTKYLILSEPYWFYPYFKLPKPYGYYWRNTHQAAYKNIINSDLDKEYFINASNIPVLHSKNITFIFNKIYDSRLANNFICNRIDAYAGSFRTSITLAIYMGFKHIYLIGCDYTHNPSISLHWYEKGEGVVGNTIGYQDKFLTLASEFIDITTISLNGKTNSSAIQSISYEEYTGEKPFYRENSELVDLESLSMLNTWPGYKIF